MILVTVGTQLGFDRLISAIDALAPNLPAPVVAQVGSGSYVPKYMEARALIAPADFEDLARASQMIVGHAGTGTILMAARFEKPLVMLPRQASLGEHRNDHQIATANAFATRAGVFVAWDVQDLDGAIMKALRYVGMGESQTSARSQLLESIGKFLDRWCE